MMEQDLPTSVPAILELEQALNDFRQRVEPLLLPEQEEEWDGTYLLAREKAIWLLGLRLVGHCIAILIFNLFTTNKVRQQATLRARGQKNWRYMSQGFFEVPITSERRGRATRLRPLQIGTPLQEETRSETQKRKKSGARLLSN